MEMQIRDAQRKGKKPMLEDSEKPLKVYTSSEEPNDRTLRKSYKRTVDS